jgi:hypothetical protein
MEQIWRVNCMTCLFVPFDDQGYAVALLAIQYQLQINGKSTGWSLGSMF